LNSLLPPQHRILLALYFIMKVAIIVCLLTANGRVLGGLVNPHWKGTAAEAGAEEPAEPSNPSEPAFPPPKSVAELEALGYKVTLLNADPMVYQFDDLLTDNEVDFLISNAAPLLERSTGGMEREVSDYRTSSTAWLQGPSHFGSSAVESLKGKVSEIMNVPILNQEHLQVLNYQPGQQYKIHHDWVHEHETVPCGPRIATFFFYLNDVEEGGGTHFPELDLLVKPMKGKAILWYNAFMDKPLRLDMRVQHAATPVLKGEKWASNLWVHIHDFITPFDNGDLNVMEKTGNETTPDAPDLDKGCIDEHKGCAMWAYSGECEANPNYMSLWCRMSCKTCKDEL